MSWNLIYVCLFFYRCAYSILAEVFVRRYTSLGDAEQYQRGLSLSDVRLSVSGDIIGDARRAASTTTEGLGTIFKFIAGSEGIGVHIFFQMLGFVGLVSFLRAIPSKHRGIALVLFLSPSFSLWTSVASKESVILLFSGLFCSQLTKLDVGNRGRFMFVLFYAFLLCVFKFQYAPAVLFIISSYIILKMFLEKSLVTFVFMFVCISMNFLFMDELSKLSFDVQRNFVGYGASTRERFFIEDYDVFYRAPFGMALSFLGPTLAEASRGILHLFSFVESIVILVVFIVFLGSRFLVIPIWNFIVGFYGILWLLFTNYPQGVMNPGSAIRYRSGYYVLIVFLILIVLGRTISSKNQDASQSLAEPKPTI